jgi:hypothetical protein
MNEVIDKQSIQTHNVTTIKCLFEYSISQSFRKNQLSFSGMTIPDHIGKRVSSLDLPLSALYASGPKLLSSSVSTSYSFNTYSKCVVYYVIIRVYNACFDPDSTCNPLTIMSRKTLAETTAETSAPGFKYSVEVDVATVQGEGKVTLIDVAKTFLFMREYGWIALWRKDSS